MDSQKTEKATSNCPWCGADVRPSLAECHADWHKAYDLHRPDCEHLLTQIAQRGSLVYYPPRACTCGLATSPDKE